MKALQRIRMIATLVIVVAAAVFIAPGLGGAPGGGVALAQPQCPELPLCPDGWNARPWPYCDCVPEEPPPPVPPEMSVCGDVVVRYPGGGPVFPVQGAQVTISPGGAGTTSNAYGHYCLLISSAGTYTVQARKVLSGVLHRGQVTVSVPVFQPGGTVSADTIWVTPVP